MSRFKHDGATEKKCLYCGQRIPLRRDGTMVLHYEKIKAAYGRKGGQRVCKGSEEGKL